MQDIIDILLASGVFTHEYSYVFYGILAWQIEQMCQAKIMGTKVTNRTPHILRSMLWGGVFIVLDDEFLARYNSIAMVDHAQMAWWMYLLVGFSIDMIRTYFVKSDKQEVAT